MTRFKQKRSILLVSALFALIVAFGYFWITTYKAEQSDAQQRQQLIDMTNAFTNAFSAHRESSGLVPATFRRIGIEQFTNDTENNATARNTASTMRMPGTPGLELETREADDHIRAIIGAMAQSDTPSSVHEHAWIEGRYIGRTIVPSVAEVQSCVDCHNAALGEGTYELGDVMGAFVVETDLTGVIRQSFMTALITSPVIFGLVYSVLARQTDRSNRVVVALKSQVQAEKRQRKAEETATFLASHDALTSAANRTLFNQRLERDCARMQMGEVDDVVVALVDLDDFKLINDTQGHDAGDSVLQATVHRLQDLTAPFDGMVARFGGDEFAVLVAIEPKGAMSRNDVLVESLGADLVSRLGQVIDHEGLTLRPDCSVGMAVISQVEDARPASVLKAADVALYAAKQAGKSRFKVFGPDLQEQLGRQRRLKAELPIALDIGALRPVLQPKIDLRTGDVYGFEALARWRLNQEEIGPNEFVPIAEECNLIDRVDFLIMERAAAFLSQLSARLDQPINLAVNVSTIDLRAQDFVERVMDVLFKAGFPPERLTLEITESVFMRDWARARQILGSLQQAGVRIALDDFGTGYSSLSYVLEFPFDEIKIDRSLIKDITTMDQNRSMLAHLIKMFQDRDKIVTVEGVETWEQVELLMQIGPQGAQGFYFAPPLELARAADLLTDLSLQSVMRKAS